MIMVDLKSVTELAKLRPIILELITSKMTNRMLNDDNYL